MRFVDQGHYDPDWLQFAVLFYFFGISNRDTMAVPFLKSDTHLNVPGINRVRINIDRTNCLPGFRLHVADVTKRIPLRDKSVKLLVLNHGVSATALDTQIQNQGQSNNYPAEVQRVLRNDGVAMAYTYRVEGIVYDYPSDIADMFHLNRFDFAFPDDLLDAISAKMGRSVTASFEELFTSPAGQPVTFFRK